MTRCWLLLPLLLPLWPAPAGEPTTAAEAAAQNVAKLDLTDEQRAAYARFKAALTPDARAWQTVLENNLGGFYLPLYIKDKIAGRTTAWDFVEDDPRLPRVLLIGDSISRGYTLAVRRALAGRANVHRAPENCGPSRNGLAKLDIWLGPGRWDLIHFNFGIHDRKTEAAVYQANLEALVDRLQATGAKLVWARTTPPPPGDLPVFTLAEGERLNQLADEVMGRRNIPLNDLYGCVIDRLAELQNKDDVHFGGPGYEVLGRQVAEVIARALGLPEKAAE